MEKSNIENNHATFLKSLFGEHHDEARRKIFLSIKAKKNAKRTLMEKLADYMTSVFGSSAFLVINAVLFVVWVLINTGAIVWVKPFDSFPFSLLTTIVSLEAIILAIFVLIAQNRTSRIDDLREEIHLQLNIISEKEITKLIKMTALLLERHGIDLSEDPELKKMIRPFSEEEIEKRLEREIL
jgi:uncharacterized membrane protein